MLPKTNNFDQKFSGVLFQIPVAGLDHPHTLSCPSPCFLISHLPPPIFSMLCPHCLYVKNAKLEARHKTASDWSAALHHHHHHYNGVGEGMQLLQLSQQCRVVSQCLLSSSDVNATATQSQSLTINKTLSVYHHHSCCCCCRSAYDSNHGTTHSTTAAVKSQI